ncbi:MAG: cytochrome P450 [Marmoricola sp.]
MLRDGGRGNDTTGALISHSVCLLQDNPEQRAELLADLSLLQTAIPEFLRLESSVQTLGRTTTREVEIHGQVIPAGEKVMMLYGCANRDEDEYGPNADELDIRREFTRMLAFSSGPHFCIGSHLAKLQARVALEELLTRYPQVRADVTNGQRHLSPFTRMADPPRALVGLLLGFGQEGEHRLTSRVGPEEPGALRGDLVAVLVDVLDELGVE